MTHCHRINHRAIACGGRSASLSVDSRQIGTSNRGYAARCSRHRENSSAALRFRVDPPDLNRPFALRTRLANYIMVCVFLQRVLTACPLHERIMGVLLCYSGPAGRLGPRLRTAGASN
jgi:hypothetical protein